MHRPTGSEAQECQDMGHDLTRCVATQEHQREQSPSDIILLGLRTVKATLSLGGRIFVLLIFAGWIYSAGAVHVAESCFHAARSVVRLVETILSQLHPAVTAGT